MFLRTEHGVLGTIDLSWSIDKSVDSHRPHLLQRRHDRSRLAVLPLPQGRREGLDRVRSRLRQGRGDARARSATSPARYAATRTLLITADDAIASVDVIAAAYRSIARQPLGRRRVAAGHPSAITTAAARTSPDPRAIPTRRIHGRAIHPTAEIEAGVEIGDGTAVWAQRARARGRADRSRLHHRREDLHRARRGRRRPREAQRDGLRADRRDARRRRDGRRRHDLHQRPLPARHRPGAHARCATPVPTSTSSKRASSRARASAPGATIGCDLTIGRWSMVGMGSVVTRDVAPFHLVVGNPARAIAIVCRCGEPVWRFPHGAAPDRRRGRCPACGLATSVARRVGRRARTARRCR